MTDHELAIKSAVYRKKLLTYIMRAGATANRSLMQFTADRVGLDLLVADIPNCAPLGAALSGALGMGLYASLEDLSAQPRKTIDYSPKMEPDQVEQRHKGWKQAV